MKAKRTPNRIKVLRLISLALFFVVFGRVGWLQAVASDDLAKKAVVSRTTDVRIEPERGTIRDATGKILAASVPSKTVYVEPQNYRAGIKKLQGDPKGLLKQLADILHLAPEDVEAKFNSNSKWILLARQVDDDKVSAIKKLGLPGIGFAADSKRVYPMGSLLAPVLGVVGVDGHGVEGLELSYDQQLYGEKGFMSEETDAKARGLMGGVHSYQPPKDGDNLTLTIDSNLQYIVEQQLDDIVATNEPKNAVIIAMDPNTGKILAMGNRPTFDPNNYSSYTEAQRRNQAISTQYEPGSTFKVITAAAAIEEGTSSPTKAYRDPGYLIVDRQRIVNAESPTGSSDMSNLTVGMEQSSNVVLGQVGLELGKEKFFKYMRGFGFGQPTGIDLPGEAVGQLMNEQMTNRFELATMSFGQANAVTPLQLITAISAVANGGTLYKPYVVDKITDNQGNIITENQPTPVRQVISKSTADQMRQIMESIVLKGTGQMAQIEGYRVAGKTGTAQKVGEDGRYSSKDYISSFVGFAPADHPRLVVLVVIDSPQKGGYYGGEIAAPRFQTIVKQALAYLNVPPSSAGSTAPSDLQPSPQPQPKPVVPERTPLPSEGVVPDLTGRTMSEVGELLSKQGFRMNFVGSGLAFSQDYPPGKVLARGTVITVKFAP